jgi:hypothetical protein
MLKKRFFIRFIFIVTLIIFSLKEGYSLSNSRCNNWQVIELLGGKEIISEKIRVIFDEKLKKLVQEIDPDKKIKSEVRFFWNETSQNGFTFSIPAWVKIDNSVLLILKILNGDRDPYGIPKITMHLAGSIQFDNYGRVKEINCQLKSDITSFYLVNSDYPDNEFMTFEVPIKFNVKLPGFN